MGDSNAANGLAEYYTEVIVADTQCLEWNFPSLPEDKNIVEKERARRRKIKDIVGSDHLDMPTLDSKNGKNGMEYCDIIVLTENLCEWEAAMMKHYASKGYRHEKKTLRATGLQITWYDEDNPVISVNMYPNKGKFMVQPGARNAERLTEWIVQCANFKNSFPQTLSEEHDDEDIEDSRPLMPTAPPLPDTSEQHAHTASTTNETDGVNTNMRELSQLHDPLMTHNIAALSKQVASLTSLVEILVDSVKNAEVNHQHQMDKITKENAEWRRVVADMTQNMGKLSWNTFRQPSKSILLGSSLIKDIDSSKLIDTSVVCKPGGKIKDIHNVITDDLSTDDKYKTMTIVVGGNDCDTTPPTSAADIVESYAKMIDDAMSKAQSVVVSSVCPRMISPDVTEKITAVNAGLQVACNAKGVTFADSTSSFYLRDGSINDGYLQHDGVHLTYRATNKLVHQLELPVKDKTQGACTQKHQKAKTQKSHGDIFKGRQSTTNQQDTPFQPDQRDTSDSSWTMVRGRRQSRMPQPHQQHQTNCLFCGEQGHNTDTCRHGQKIQCHSCHHLGHKEKLCHLY